MNKEEKDDKSPTQGINASELVSMLDRRIGESQSFWNGEYKLEEVAKENQALYHGEQASKKADEQEETPSLDNRIFSSVRTIVPYVTSRVTEPMVYPSSNSQSAKRFAQDMEKALYIHAENEEVKAKAKFALEDAIIQRRGYLKPRYDPVRKNFCSVEYVPCESIIVDHKARPFEEPRYFRHLLEKSVEDLLVMFPDMEKEIYLAFGCDEKTPKDKLQQEHTINEDWVFVPDDEGGLDLVVCWNYKSIPLSVIQDPNWNYEGDNFLKHHMMPLVFFNVLSNGRKLVDRTSFVEQSKYLQLNVDERGEQISLNAGLGSVGMPVVDSKALDEEQTPYLRYEANTVLALDLENSGASSIRDVFDVWKAGAMPAFVYEDKIDSRNGIDNAFGTPNVFRGEQSKNNTLGQDVLVRDQAFGRQQEIVDAIDTGMRRLYMLMAQFLLVYGGHEERDDGTYEMFEFTGENSEFDYVMLNTDELDTKVKIRIKAGTSMPIDRAQRRATADKAATGKMIDPLTYWEIMDEGNAQKYAKRLMQFTTDPAAYMKDTEEGTFNRDAFVDIQVIKQGGQPEFREELPKEYFDYLNQYVLSGDLDNPMIDEGVRAAISQFIDTQLARGQKMLGAAETQLPTPEEVNTANEQIDQANQAEMQATGAMPAKPQPKQPEQLALAPVA